MSVRVLLLLLDYVGRGLVRGCTICLRRIVLRIAMLLTSAIPLCWGVVATVSVVRVVHDDDKTRRETENDGEVLV